VHKFVDSNIVLLYHSTQIDTPSSDGYVFHKIILSTFMGRCSFLLFEHNAGVEEHIENVVCFYDLCTPTEAAKPLLFNSQHSLRQRQGERLSSPATKGCATRAPTPSTAFSVLLGEC